MTVELVAAASPDQWATARRLVEEYVASLGVDLGFQDVDEELAHLSAEYGPPDGLLLLALAKGEGLGCVAMRPFGPGTAEMKRLYVRPKGRGRGLGRTLALAIIDEARRRGYNRMVLDTLPSMTQARALYQELGFRPIPAYRHNPIAGTAFLELRLA